MGRMYVDGAFQAYTLELPVKDGLPGSAIPAGTYKVVTYPSPKFGRLMPLIEGIPERSNIEIHWLNTPEQTQGCIGVGNSPGHDFIGDSRAAFDALWAKAQGAMESGECQITVESQHHVDLSASDL